MSDYRFPTVFFSHGTPMNAFGEDAFQTMLHRFGESHPKPKAIIFVSAHSLSNDTIHVLASEKHTIQYDFGGFPEELYQIQYQCPGEPDLSLKIAELLSVAGFKTTLEKNTPLDHGVWVPLLHMVPKGDIPVVRISLPLSFSPPQILKMGHTLASLREQGVMLVGSGGAVHNLRQLKWSEKNSPGFEWAMEFESLLITALQQKSVEALLAIEEHPLFHKAHPTTEHFLPMLFTIGGTLMGDEVDILYKGIEYGSLSMLCFSLNHVQNPPLH